MKETNKNINNSNYNSTEDNYYFLNVLKQLFEDALKFSSKYINDGNSIYYHIDYELEQALQNDKKLLFEKIEILKNIYTSPEEVEFIDRFALFYDTFNKIYIGVKHSEGFSHYLTVRFLKDSLKEYLIYQTDNYSIEFLTSFDDIDFEISKNKSKLAFSLIELKLNGKVDRNFMDKYFESIDSAKKLDSLYKTKNANLKGTAKKNITLFDFVKDPTNNDLIAEVQSLFCTYDGKRLAILICLLQDMKIISISPSSKTHSRKKFVQLFKKDNSIKNIEAVNKHIDSYTYKLNFPVEFDADYIDIKEKLNKITENKVV